MKKKTISSEFEDYLNMNASTKKKKRFISTGSDIIDIVVGGGIGKGFPIGKIVNIVGDSSSGKSFLACETIAAARSQYGKNLVWCYDDAESGLTHDTSDLYGFDIRQNERKSSSVEDWFCNVVLFAEELKPADVGIYILDSLDGLDSKEIQSRADKRISKFKKGEDFNEGSFQMGKAKFLSQEFFKKVAGVIEEKNILLLIISQTRDKIDSMFKEQRRNGGKALDFFSHTVLWLSNIHKTKKIVDKVPRTSGVVVKAKTTKSKTPRPYRTCVFSILFNYGVDNIGSNIDYLFSLRGERGELLSAAKSITWGSSKEPTLQNVKEFMNENGYMNDFKKKNPTFKKSAAIEYIKKGKDRLAKYNVVFGNTYSRKALIEYIESDEKQEQLLSKMVEEKWEAAEQEALPKRKKKY